jgi:hypothetical protein
MTFTDDDIIVVNDCQAFFGSQITDKFGLSFMPHVVYTPEDEEYWEHFFHIEE